MFAVQWALRRPEDPSVPRELRKLISEISTATEDPWANLRAKVVVVTACQPDKLTDPLLVTVDVFQETLSMAPDTILPASDPSHTDRAVNPVATRALAPAHTQTVTDTLADMEVPGEQFAHFAFQRGATTLVRITKMAQ